MVTYERGNVVWGRTKYMFFDGRSLGKSEVHICTHKIVILGFNEDIVSFGSKYLKRVFGLPDRHNFFTTHVSNLSFYKSELLFPSCEYSELYNNVYFIIPKSGLKGWIAKKVGLGDYYETLKFLSYLRDGMSSSISIRTLHNKMHIPTHIVKYTQMNLVDWTKNLPSSHHNMMYSLLRKI